MDTLYFWRSSTGDEVDALIEKGGRLHAIEMKSGRTIGSDFFSTLHTWKKTAANSAGRLFLVYGGDAAGELTGIATVPWRNAADIVNEI